MPRQHTTSDPEYRRNRERLLRDRPPCAYCGGVATQADHVVPVSAGGGNEMDNLVPACARCNSRKGAGEGRALAARRDAGRRQHLTDVAVPIEPARTRNDLLGGGGCPRPPFAPFRGDPDRPEPAPMGHDRPRLETPVEDRGRSLAAAVGGWAERHLGRPLMAWQVHALEGITSMRPDGRFAARTAVVSTARQQGKTFMLMALLGYLATEEPRRRGEPLTILSTSHRLDVATELFLQLSPILLAHYGGKANNQYSRSEWRGEDGTRWLVRASGPSIGHGLSLDVVLADEAWDLSTDVIEAGLRPTMRARPNPLMVVVSTAGTEASTALMRMREQGLRSIDRGEAGGLYFAEWSPPPDVDPMTVEAWKYANPALGKTLDVDTIRAEAEAPDRASFLRSSVNLWITAERGWISPGRWEELRLADGIELPAGGVLAVEASLDGSRYFGVRAVPLGDGRVAVTVAFHVDTVAECLAAIDDAARNDLRLRFAVSPTIDLHVGPSLASRKVVVGYRELTRFTQPVRNMVIEGTLVHTGEEMLAEHMNRAVAVRTQGSIALSSQRSAGPIELARCVVWAAALASRPVRMGKPMIVTAAG